jgi:hypothetical protein
LFGLRKERLLGGSYAEDKARLGEHSPSGSLGATARVHACPRKVYAQNLTVTPDYDKLVHVEEELSPRPVRCLTVSIRPIMGAMIVAINPDVDDTSTTSRSLLSRLTQLPV